VFLDSHKLTSKEVDLACSVLASCKAAMAGSAKGGKANLGGKRKAQCPNDVEGGKVLKAQKRKSTVCRATLHSKNSSCPGKGKRKCQKEANKRMIAKRQAEKNGVKRRH
jgi:hypothetical protein